MSDLGQRTLIGLLDDTESVEFLAREGLDLKVVPNPALRPLVEWSLRQFRTTGKAPTRAMIDSQFPDLLADNDLADVVDVEETIEWAVDDLKSSFARNMAGDFSRRLSIEITNAAPDERLDVLGKFVTEIAATYMSLQPRTSQVDLTASGDDILGDYQEAVATQGQVRGMAFGLPQIDTMTRGVHEGELCMVAGGAKTGKSWFLNHVAHNEWSRERVTALFTLENSIEMTRMRIACVALGISYEALQAGTLSDEESERLRHWVNDVLLKSETPLLIFNPVNTGATPQAIVQAARAYGADSLIVDQLSHIENGQQRGANQPRTYEVRDILRDLKGLISSGRHRMPCVLAHQINREGMKAADKSGRLEMWHLADSADAERTCDMIFGLYASTDMRAVGRMQFQTLAARRFPGVDFDLLWQIGIGRIGVINSVDLSAV
jgi:hypothetical protein